MPDLLSPTNPVPKYDSAAARSAPILPNDTAIQNIVDPQKVVRPDGKTDQQNADDAAASNKMRYESNFLSFLQRLRNAPDLADAFQSLMRGGGLHVSSGISEGLAAELKQFLELLKMDEGKLLSFLQNQLKSGSRFSGPLFQSLYTALLNARSDVLRTDILQFLRQYSDHSSTPYLEGNILRTLYDMSKSLPAKWGDQLLALGAQFENGAAAGDRAGNLKLLREQVFPLMAGYVSRTHDHGRARNLLSLLTLDMIRYENGDASQLVQAFRSLNRFDIPPGDFSRLSDAEILRLLRETGFQKESENNAFASQLASLTGRALSGEGSLSAQQAFQNIMTSILLNESVYMPLRHVMLPFEWNGRAAFSELWIDPDSGGRGDVSSEKELRILIKMDVEGLGAFDLLVAAKGINTSLQLTCPPQLAGFSGNISRQLSGILERNGLKAAEINVAAMKRPLTITEVFPHLFTKEVNGVDVKI